MAIVNLNNEYTKLLQVLKRSLDLIESSGIELTEDQQKRLAFAKSEFEKLKHDSMNLLDYNFRDLKIKVAKIMHADLMQFKSDKDKLEFKDISSTFFGVVDTLIAEVKRLKEQGQTEYKVNHTANQNNQGTNYTHTENRQSSTNNTRSHYTNSSYEYTEDYSREWRPDYNPPPPRSSKSKQEFETQAAASSEYNGPVQILIDAIQRWVRIFITKRPSNLEEFDKIKQALERHLNSISSYIRTVVSQKENFEQEISTFNQAFKNETSDYNINAQYQNVLTELFNQYRLDGERKEVFERQIRARKQTLEPMVMAELQKLKQEYCQTFAAYQRLLFDLQNGLKFANSPYFDTGLTCQQASEQMYAWMTERQNLEQFARNQVYNNDSEYKKIWSCYYSANVDFGLSRQKYENYANNPAEMQAKIQMGISDKYEKKCEPLYKKYDKAVADLKRLNAEWSKLYDQYQTFLATYQEAFTPEEASMGRKYG